MIEVRYRKTDGRAKAPEYATDGSAGMDLKAVTRTWDADHKVWDYGFGLAFEIPEGYAGFIFPRSSVYKTPVLLTNCVGVIDSDYRGEVRAKFRPLEDVDSTYMTGQAIAQIVFMRVLKADLKESEELTETERGDGGFGSTGV